MIVIDKEGNIVLHPAAGKELLGLSSYQEPE